MQNLLTLHAAHLPLRLPPAPQTPLLTAAPEPHLHTVHRSDITTLIVTSFPLPPTNTSTTTVAIHTAEPTTPTALLSLTDSLVLALRTGEIHAVRPAIGTAIAVGDVTDPDPARSGVLAAATSPDGNIVAVVSPVSLTLLDASFTTLAELPLPMLASHAALTWRSDGDYLALVFRAFEDGVFGFVVDRGCTNMATLDIDTDLAHQLAVVVEWQPRVGGFIAVAGPGAGITFFERNGQRHRRSDFQVLAAGTPKLLRWSRNCAWLAVAVEEHEDQGEGDAWRVAFFAQCNYRWYCKKRLILEHRILAIHWDEDQVGAVTIVTERDVITLRVFSEPSTISLTMTAAIAAVTDGTCIELTDFAKAIVPPPLCHAILTCDEDISAVCVMRHGEGFAMLTSSGLLEWVVLENGLVDVRVSPKPNELTHCFRSRRPLFAAEKSELSTFCFRMPVLSSRSCAVVVGPSVPWRDCESGPPADALYMFPLSARPEEGRGEACRMLMDGRVTAIGHSSEEMSVVLTTSSGALIRFVVDEFARRFVEVARVVNISTNAISVQEVRIGRGRSLTLLLDEDGRLSAVELASTKQLLVSKECTSFCVHVGFLIFTTRSHLLYCVLLDTKSSLSSSINSEIIPSVTDALDSSEDLPQLQEGHGATRPIDRGSLIVTSLRGKTDIILQTPRGNLETISPRPVVFEEVDRLAKGGEYGKAFDLCRRQRVDMNHIVNANFEVFLRDIGEFVAQVRDANHLSVFMTFLNGEPSKTNAVCRAIVQTLRNMGNSLEFTSAILTGLVRQEPSDIKTALEEIARVREVSMDEGSSAVDFLFVLVKDEQKVYLEALGTYDLSLAAFIAESSQMNPADYTRELHDLRSLQGSERMYTIDTRLQRYDKALGHLFACGETRYKDCVQLCHEQKLYDTALLLFANQPIIRKDLLNGYGCHLRDIGQYEAAAAAFLCTEDWRAVADCYRMGGRWEMAINALSRVELPEEDKRAIYMDIADDLADVGRVIECARIRVTILGNIEGALEVLSITGEWDAAIEAVSVYETNYANHSESIDMKEVQHRLMHCVVEGSESLLGTIRENCEKLRERGNRLRTLREATQRLREGMSHSKHDDAAEETESDVFSASSASSFGSNLSDVTFTSKTSATSLYSTVTSHTGPLSKTKLEKQALRRQQRASKKRIREGHPNEQEYLVGYLRKLVPGRFLKDRVAKTTRALVFVGRQDLGNVVLSDMSALVDQALALPEDIITKEMHEELEERSWSVGNEVLSVLGRAFAT